jgi:hypothetical protein
MAYFDPAEIASFWRALVQTAWAKRPARFEAPFSRAFASEEECLRILQAWSSQARQGEISFELSWLHHGAMPTNEDRSLDEFFARVDRNWGKDWFLYLPDGVQELDGNLWERAVEILEPSFGLTGGLPPGGVNLDLLIGKYDRTPFGIHIDMADTLALIVKGPKRLLFWPRDAFTPVVGASGGSHQPALTMDIERHIDTAIVIDANAGDVVYWPRAFWHIGTSPRNWASMITIAMWWDASRRASFQPLVTELMQSMRPPSVAFPIDHAGSHQGGPRGLPPPLEEGLASLRRSVAEDAERILERIWLQFVTCHGFNTAPACRPQVELLPDTRWIVEHPVVVTARADSVFVFACGHMLEMPEGAAARAARVLERGSRWSLATLFDDGRVAAHVDEQDEIVDLVTELHAVRAVSIEPRASTQPTSRAVPSA